MSAARAALAPPPLFHVVLHEPEIPNNTGNIGRTCIATHCALHLIKPLGFDTSEKACRRPGLDYWPRLRPTEHESFEAYLRWCGNVDGSPTIGRRVEPEPARGQTNPIRLARDTSAGGSAPCNPQEEIRPDLIEGERGGGIHPPHQHQRSHKRHHSHDEVAHSSAGHREPQPRTFEGGETNPPRLWLFTTKAHAGKEQETRSIPVFDADFQPGDHLVFGKETRGLPDDLLDHPPAFARLVTFPMARGERSLNLATAVCAAVYEGLRQLRARGEISFSTDENRIVTG